MVEGDDWSERLAAFADERVRKAAAAEDDERPGLAGRFRHEADQAQSSASFVTALMRDLASGDALGTWAGAAAWASGPLDRYVGDDRSGWPQPEREAADRVGAAVERWVGSTPSAGPRRASRCSGACSTESSTSRSNASAGWDRANPWFRAVLLFLGPTGAVEREVDVSSVDIPRSPGTSRGVNQ